MTDERNHGVSSIPITRTELVWPGKYNPDGSLREAPRVTLPFQVIERVNETRATREARKQPQELSLFDVWDGTEGETFDDGWRNKLIWGDNLLVMSSLLEKFAGKVDLIYIDPPFATGADFSFDVEFGDGGTPVYKEQSLIEEKAYRDMWGGDGERYVPYMHHRLSLMRDLLSSHGVMAVHLDWRVSPVIRLVLDDLFGRDHFVNELVWRYGKMSNPTRRFAHSHDQIMVYRKGDDYTFNVQKGGVSEYRNRYERWVGNDNTLRYGSVAGSADKLIALRVRKVEKELGRPVEADDVLFDFNEERKVLDDVFTDISIIKGNAAERTSFPTQKPEGLLERIIEAYSNSGDLVADFFVGSGTTGVVAEKLGRRWIACDFGRFAVHTTRKRFLDVEGCKPFEILNLGRYERQYWQGVTFGDASEGTERALFEYLAFLLRLYGAEPVSGLSHVHGKKGKSMVHIGSVDAPVTIDEIVLAVEECNQLDQAELHVLGWEWEMGLYDLMVDEARKRGVKLAPLQIPREVMEQQAVEKGDVQFFELAHVEFDVSDSNSGLAVTLTDFVIANTELIPEDVREKVKEWSDYVDYWAVDWDFRDDTFMQGWVAYRTRQDRSLELTSDPHEYEQQGTYTIVVKVIDIFGNDTSQAFEIQVD